MYITYNKIIFQFKQRGQFYPKKGLLLLNYLQDMINKIDSDSGTISFKVW